MTYFPFFIVFFFSGYISRIKTPAFMDGLVRSFYCIHYCLFVKRITR